MRLSQARAAHDRDTLNGYVIAATSRSYRDLDLTCGEASTEAQADDFDVVCGILADARTAADEAVTRRSGGRGEWPEVRTHAEAQRRGEGTYRLASGGTVDVGEAACRGRVIDRRARALGARR